MISSLNLDVICLNETHLVNEKCISVSGYRWYGYNRQGIHCKAPKGSGGVGILLKEALLEDYQVKIVDKSIDGILGISLEHKVSEYKCYVYCCYLSPDNSHWGRDSVQFFAHLLSQVYMYSTQADAFVICGDFNARCGELSDCIDGIDDVRKRTVIDNVINAHGHALIEFLQEAKFCILNGRVCPENDNYTCITPRGRSVVDYLLVPHDLLNKCVKFQVLPMTDLIQELELQCMLSRHCKVPDHALLIVELCVNVSVTASENGTYSTPSPDTHNTHNRYRKYNFKRAGPEFTNSELFNLAMLNIINMIEANRESQAEIDLIYDQFREEIIQELNRNVPYHNASKSSKKRWRTKKAFWCTELEVLWKDMHQADKVARKARSRNDKRHSHAIFRSKRQLFDRRYRQLERAYRREKWQNIEKIQTDNPSDFWKEIKTLGPKKKQSIPLEVYDSNEEVISDPPSVLSKWKNEFTSLYVGPQGTNNNIWDDIVQENQFRESIMLDPLWEENTTLNHNFTLDEIRRVVMKAKSGKSAGIDNIPYEALKSETVIKVLWKLFQLCFDSGKIPSIWLDTIVNPLIKSKDSDPRIPLNYRGISLICCSAKLYSSVINARLMSYLESEGKIVDEQNGFRKDRSCRDHIFVLNSLCEHNINEDRSLFAAFIDFKKAFDCINRNFLSHKVLKEGIEGKMYWAIKSLYSATRACVRVNNYFTDWFDCLSGVKQGDTLSPTLFALYINDLAVEIKALNKGISIDGTIISILLYADDIILLADNEHDLQDMLDVLHNWSQKWLLEINNTKSNILHIRKKNSERSKFQFKVGSELLHYKSSYKYLGVTFNEYNDFSHNASLLAESANRALGSLVSKYKMNSYMGYGPYTKLFEACVLPVMLYGAEVWGYNNFANINKVQQRAMRVFLGVHSFAPIAGIEGDMGWVAPRYKQWLKMLSFWNRLVQLDTGRITKKVFDWSHSMAMAGYTNWCSQVQAICRILNIEDTFINREQCDLNYCEEMLRNIQEAEWKENVNKKPKLRFYSLFKKTFRTENYVKLNLDPQQRSLTAQLRLGILPLRVETGRFVNLALDDRKCEICNTEAIEDECHFLFECERYKDLRENWEITIKNQCNYIQYLELEDQLSFLFEDIPRSTAKYIVNCFMQRKSYLFG